MTTEQKDSPATGAKTFDSMALFGAHLVWSMLGPMALAFLLISIVSGGGGWCTAVDIVYVIALVLVVGSRWILHRLGRAVTTDGQPSTWLQFRRWALVLVPIAVAGWAVANLVGQHFVRGVSGGG